MHEHIIHDEYYPAFAEFVDASKMENPARCQRIVDALAEAVAGTSIRTLAGIRDNLAIAVFAAARRQSCWTPAQTSLAESATSRLQVLGPAVLIGISAEHPSTSFIPKALQEATIAVNVADATKRVVAYPDQVEPGSNHLVREHADTA